MTSAECNAGANRLIAMLEFTLGISRKTHPEVLIQSLAMSAIEAVDIGKRAEVKLKALKAGINYIVPHDQAGDETAEKAQILWQRGSPIEIVVNRAERMAGISVEKNPFLIIGVLASSVIALRKAVESGKDLKKV